MILNGECGVFSPKLLECFKSSREEFVRLTHSYADGHSPKADLRKAPARHNSDRRKNRIHSNMAR